jgi:aminoglycoside/choline kinase family phosphotransferase
VNSDPRKAEMMTWLATIDAVAGLCPEAASADASFRRYFRLQANDESFIVMDAPPPEEDCLPFVCIAGYLEAMQLSAPRILESNLQRGFLLLSDLGSQSFLMSLTDNPDSAASLYTDAMQAIVTMQSNGSAYQSLLPAYDETLLRRELSLFHDWLCETHIGMQFSATEESEWQALCDLLVANALEQPQVFVHRDYHSRNLMKLTTNNPGLLDFQDAVEGPYTYDLVSLLKDCYVRWPAEQVHRWALDFYAMLQRARGPQPDQVTFLRQFELMGVQRHLKAAGIFARLNHRDGKPGYLADIPRTLQYVVELGPRHAELDFIARLIDDKCLPALVSSA